MQQQQQQPRDQGRIVTASGHVFRIIDGRRYWISKPPQDYLKDNAEDCNAI
jgi:hypothetical protein